MSAVQAHINRNDLEKAYQAIGICKENYRRPSALVDETKFQAEEDIFTFAVVVNVKAPKEKCNKPGLKNSKQVVDSYCRLVLFS